jgi:protoheme IX farnesyltransferase
MSDLLTLTRWRIALLNVFSAAAGCLLASPTPGWRLWTALAGTFLLGCGAAALNQIQERQLDARMERTAQRPLPAGRMTLTTASLICAVLLLAGLGTLGLTGHISAVLLGVGAVASYNFFYTPLKRVTPYAAVIGAVVGAFPPALGWAAVAGWSFSPAAWSLMLFLVLWQVPHFWLLLLRIAPDYERAGLPSLTGKLRPEQLRRVTSVWSVAAATVVLLLPLFGAIRHVALFAVLTVVTAWLAWRVVTALLRQTDLQRAFLAINGLALATMSAIIADGAWETIW